MLAVVAGLLAWLWPIGIGGKMPVGGDVTQFFIGLMGFLGESLRAGSAAGLERPVGLRLSRPRREPDGGLLPGSRGPLSLAEHRDGLRRQPGGSIRFGEGWEHSGRRGGWESRRAGSALAAFSWSTCGFFLIHLAHPWGYTTGCWMPWAWGLTWCCLASAGRAGKAGAVSAEPGAGPPALAGTLSTGVHDPVRHRSDSVVGGARALGWPSAGRALRRRLPISRFEHAGGWRGSCWRWPAFSLWRRFSSGRRRGWRGWRARERDFEYLSGFASTPFHLVNFVAPGFFHRSPLWRPLVWDPFHTSPEELLAYVGLVPLFLAVMAMVREWRRDVRSGCWRSSSS